MATRKRPSISTNSVCKRKEAKRQVTKDTFQKWQGNYERDYQSMVWLCAELDSQDKSLVSTLSCAVCQKHVSRICGIKNFSRAWIDGSTNHKTSNITDHANSEQHKVATMEYRKDQAKKRNEPKIAIAPLLAVSCHHQWISLLESKLKGSLMLVLLLLKSISLSQNTWQSMI